MLQYMKILEISNFFCVNGKIPNKYKLSTPQSPWLLLWFFSLFIFPHFAVYPYPSQPSFLSYSPHSSSFIFLSILIFFSVSLSSSTPPPLHSRLPSSRSPHFPYKTVRSLETTEPWTTSNYPCAGELGEFFARCRREDRIIKYRHQAIILRQGNTGKIN